MSDRPPRRPLCDCFEHAQNFPATMASMTMSERPMCTREAQRSQPLCGGIIGCHPDTAAYLFTSEHRTVERER